MAESSSQGAVHRLRTAPEQYVSATPSMRTTGGEVAEVCWAGQKAAGSIIGRHWSE